MVQGCHILHLKKQQGLRVRKTADAQALDVESAKATVHRTHRLRRKQLAPRLGLNKARENSILSPRGFGMQAYGEEDGILLRDLCFEIKGNLEGRLRFAPCHSFPPVGVYRSKGSICRDIKNP